MTADTVPTNDPTERMTPRERVLYKLDRVADSDAVTLAKDDLREVLTSWHDAALAVYWAWDDFERATNPVLQARAVTRLDDAVSDLASWLPGYDDHLGRIPYDDEQDENPDRIAFNMPMITRTAVTADPRQPAPQYPDRSTEEG
jgi:hypothetical protein